ncbi:MAG: AbrB/MazE/SpoVT family DNA-binding domain-containing protein [Candidatus Korarchaeota archaeon]|nr:AbrB/MazE/SpoVT family DNA-binding domain-containing protein [Candidatus Korarchaeota archaeon]
MNQTTTTIRVGRRYALYIPKRVVEALGIEEGDLVAIEVRDGEIRLRPVKRPKPGEYWAEVGPEEVEEFGEDLSRGAIG